MSQKVGVSFAECFKIDENYLRKKGVFNPTLDIDSPLFIDPFMLPKSKQREFSGCAFEKYEQHFIQIYKILSSPNAKDGKLWKAAFNLFKFNEEMSVSGTCLGYSKKSTKGHAFGDILAERSLNWAKSVIDLGVEDPELFSVLSLFEDKIGPDLISDMIINISNDCILEFNKRIYSEIKKDLGINIPLQEFIIKGNPVNLPQNPYSNDKLPIILLADDVLKHLPILDDTIKIRHAAEHNAELRNRVNKHISNIFKIKNKSEKEELKKWAMESAEAFQSLLDLLKITEKDGYNIYKDPYGILEWRLHARNFTALYPKQIEDDKSKTEVERLNFICVQIIEQYRHLIENCRMNNVFYVDNKPRREKFAQLLFYSIAVSYCDANNIDVSPESDGGAGPVDFKFSHGNIKILVEIKLSTNSKLLAGYEKQLEAYMAAEKAALGHYVVLLVGKEGKKLESVHSFQKSNPEHAKLKQLHVINAEQKLSASKL